MHGLFLRQFCWLLAGLPLAGWCMFVSMRFLIFACAWDVLVYYQKWGVVGRGLFIIVELGFFEAFNNLRHYVVKEAYNALVPSMRPQFPLIVCYATLLWLVNMLLLLTRLWVAMPSYHPALLFQFFLLALGLSVMMGIALPYSAPRGWVFVWRYWKARKNTESR